ncbi:7685_t:CDS:2 [Entrophospora sp. SA101]|nr:7685_t:CDS:2 [Entrophospora sp. SA101]
MQRARHISSSQRLTPSTSSESSDSILVNTAPGINAIPREENLRYFDALMTGPIQSPFEGGIFNLKLFHPGGYPLWEPPKVRFLTKIYHPNINKNEEQMDTSFTVRTVLISVQALLSSPNPEQQFDMDVRLHWRENETAAISIAQEWTRNYA